MSEPRTTLRMSRVMRARLKAAADRERRSVHAQVLVYIERGLAQDEAEEGSEEKRDAGRSG